jgi:hypothetical protein
MIFDCDAIRCSFSRSRFLDDMDASYRQVATCSNGSKMSPNGPGGGYGRLGVEVYTQEPGYAPEVMNNVMLHGKHQSSGRLQTNRTMPSWPPGGVPSLPPAPSDLPARPPSGAPVNFYLESHRNASLNRPRHPHSSLMVKHSDIHQRNGISHRRELGSGTVEVEVRKRLGADWKRLILLGSDGIGMCSPLTNLIQANCCDSGVGSQLAV